VVGECSRQNKTGYPWLPLRCSTHLTAGVKHEVGYCRLEVWKCKDKTVALSKAGGYVRESTCLGIVPMATRHAVRPNRN
jgi:hypothetical protein